MTITTSIKNIDRINPKLSSFILKADTCVRDEFLQFIETEEFLASLDDKSSAKEQLKEQLFLIYECANKKAMMARRQKKYNLWLIWEQIINILDLACESLEDEMEADFYLTY